MDGRKQELNKTTSVTQNTALTKLYHVAPQAKLIVNQTMMMIHHYLFNVALTPETPKTKTKGRVKTKYEDNVTAALSLSTEPKSEVKPCVVKKVEIEEKPSSLQLLASTIYNLFSHHKDKPPEKKQDNIIDTQIDTQSKKKKKTPSVMQAMIKLVSEFKELEDPEGKDKTEAENILLKQVDLVEQEIIEHAQRRVDLYFYLLVAVYKQNAVIEKKSTNKQHGVGTNQHGSQAAHDSLFPNVKMKYPNSIGNLVWSLFTTLPSIKGTHFEDSNNMTVELPQWVNKFDTYLELRTPGRPSAPSSYVNECLTDLNLASFGKITPIEGMNRFLKNIKNFFKEFNEKYLIEDEDKIVIKKTVAKNKKCKEIEIYPRLMKRIWELQYMGTLRAQAFDSQKVDIEYLCSLLRASYGEKIIKDPNKLLSNCMAVQKEILYSSPCLKK